MSPYVELQVTTYFSFLRGASSCAQLFATAAALGIEALEMIAPLTPGAPVCRAHAPGSPADGGEFVFKGGQVGAQNYFEML